MSSGRRRLRRWSICGEPDWSGAFVHTGLIRNVGLSLDKLELENGLRTVFQQKFKELIGVATNLLKTREALLVEQGVISKKIEEFPHGISALPLHGKHSNENQHRIFLDFPKAIETTIQSLIQLGTIAQIGDGYVLIAEELQLRHGHHQFEQWLLTESDFG
nr:ATP-dependent RNA helicase DEAH11, chloroplastic-like [Ipomoea batatas]